MVNEESLTLRLPLGDKVETIELASYVSQTGQKFYGRPQTEDTEVFESVVDRNEYRLPLKFESRDIIIDIGAHVGSFSYAVLTRGAGKVYSYEAHPINHAIASRNLARFGEKVECRNAAVWRSDEHSQTLYNDVITGYAHTGGISILWNDAGVPVRTTNLDEVLFEASNGLENPIRLLKLDCEGSEYPILFTSEHLGIVEEMCGEYHEIEPERIPDRAKVKGKPEQFNRHALKSFLENKGWRVELDPKVGDYGLFHAYLKKRHRSPEAKEDGYREVDVKQLMAEIKQAASQRQDQESASLTDASAALAKLLSPSKSFASLRAKLPKLKWQDDFAPHDDNLYHVNDLVKYHDADFVRNAYRALLRREPDASGYEQNLQNLRGGSFNKLDLLASLRYSPEGEANNVKIKGLALPTAIRRFYRVPVLGYIMSLAVGLARLPAFVRHQSHFEAYALALHQQLVAHTDQAINQLADNISLLADNISLLAETSETQQQATDLQHQQLGAVFREQQQIISEQKNLYDEIYVRPLEMQAEVKQLSESQRSATEELTAYVEAQVRELSQKFQQMRAELTLHERSAAQLVNEPRQNPSGTFDRQQARNSDARVNHHLDALYAAFENEFRGERDDIKERHKVYLPFLRQSEITSNVLDLGCGRGEWLELLRNEGIAARGLDINRVTLEECRAQGLEVIETDMLAHLRTLPDAGLNCVTAFHLIEHLPFEILVALIDEILRVLKPSGLVIFETPNPENVVTGSCNFYLDPTHHHPLPRALMKFVLDARGFDDLQIVRLHPVDEMRVEGDSKLTIRFNDHLYGPMDYAIIGRKP